MKYGCGQRRRRIRRNVERSTSKRISTNNIARGRDGSKTVVRKKTGTSLFSYVKKTIIKKTGVT
jgi:hypothetical protein